MIIVANSCFNVFFSYFLSPFWLIFFRRNEPISIALTNQFYLWIFHNKCRHFLLNHIIMTKNQEWGITSPSTNLLRTSYHSVFFNWIVATTINNIQHKWIKLVFTMISKAINVHDIEGKKRKKEFTEQMKWLF